MSVVECYGGGTAMGAVQVYGAQRQRLAIGIPDEIHGTSVGSLTAVMRAADKLDRLEAIWRSEIKGTRSFQRLKLDVWNGLFQFGPLRKIIAREISPSDFRCPVYAHCVDLGSKRYNRVYLNDLTPCAMLDALIASSTQYGIHAVAKIEGRAKADGGIKHVIPLPSQPWERFSTAVVFACSPITHVSRDHEIGQQEIGPSRMIEILLDTVEANDYRRIRLWVEHGMSVTLVQPQERPGDPFDASPTTNNWRLDVVGVDAWRSRSSVEPRPGLRLDPSQLTNLESQLRSEGLDLNKLLR